ncbi:hypothetical protein RJ55_06794 [Drechmeria coniospora]|nr:hypothetical protein RJ55_06794 [Drechmeria coniospora]
MNVRFQVPFDAEAYRTAKAKSKAKATELPKRPFKAPSRDGCFIVFSTSSATATTGGAESAETLNMDVLRVPGEHMSNPSGMTAQSNEGNLTTHVAPPSVRARKTDQLIFFTDANSSTMDLLEQAVEVSRDEPSTKRGNYLPQGSSSLSSAIPAPQLAICGKARGEPEAMNLNPTSVEETCQETMTPSSATQVVIFNEPTVETEEDEEAVSPRPHGTGDLSYVTAPNHADFETSPGEWEALRIIGEELMDGKLHYMMEWKPSLVSEDDAHNAAQLIRDWNKQKARIRAGTQKGKKRKRT